MKSPAEDVKPTQLAGSVLNLAGSLRELQRYDDAVTADLEAVTILRADLQSENPHEKAVERVTWVLHLLGDDLRDAHRLEEALAAYRDVVEICRSNGRPEHVAHALQPMIRTLRALGRQEEAQPLEDELAELQAQAS